MSKVDDFIKVFRQASKNASNPVKHTAGASNQSPINSPRRNRAFLAFASALFLVASTWFIAGTNIPGVVAQEGDNAAAFFRADRARYRARKAVSNIRTLSIYRDKKGQSIAKRGRVKGANKRARKVRFSKPAERNLVNKLQKTAGFQPLQDGRNFKLGNRSVCVRLCDGYSFPVGKLDRRSDINAHEAVCSGLCPGAPTALYVLSSGAQDVSEAVSARGSKPYAALSVALRYTAKREKTCSCRAPQQNHLALVSLRKDFTLRKGDAVMTKRGIRVFKGAKHWPYRKRDFTTLRRSRRLVNRSARASLASLERASSAKFSARQAANRLRDRVRLAVDSQPIAAFVPLPPPRPVHFAVGATAIRR